MQGTSQNRVARAADRCLVHYFSLVHIFKFVDGCDKAYSQLSAINLLHAENFLHEDIFVHEGKQALVFVSYTLIKVMIKIKIK